MPDNRIPVFQDYMNPILAALRALGGSATIENLNAQVFSDMKLAPSLLAIPHKPEQPDYSEVAYRNAWARTYLKKAGLLTNPSPGTWALTEVGKTSPEVDARALASNVAKDRSERGETDEREDDPDEGGQLDPRIASDILGRFDGLLARGLILRKEQAGALYQRFRERFGPEALASLDGERLLMTMHGRQNRDSLVYWLEFKDDEDFPARFGSIAGGSALKFGIYQAKDSGDWWTGSSTNQTPLSIESAVAKVREQRNELVRGAAVLSEFGRTGTADYAALQERMTEAAPSVAETAWGHKYFSLLYPELLDDFHAPTYQRFHLIKLLRVPSDGRYANAGLFVSAARELGITPNQLATVLNHRNGSPHEYWRVGTTIGNEDAWPGMRDGKFAAIGWGKLGDLSDLPATKQGKDSIRARLAELYPGDAGVTTWNSQEVFNFVANTNERDVVVAASGRTVQGIGIVTGPYYFQGGNTAFPHRHPVEWRDLPEWRLPLGEPVRPAFRPIGKNRSNLVAIERMFLGGSTAAASADPSLTVRANVRAVPSALTGILGRIHGCLQRKRQVILYGPPGTGKTFWADTAISEIVARSWFGKAHGELSEEERDEVKRAKAVGVCTFHSGYGYEDFIEGYRPVKTGDGVAFELKTGVFKSLCERAKKDSNRDYFLLIDEINRGDIPRIFGELLTLLEHDKRGKELTLPLSQEQFSVPRNVFVVATMNTADRSIALLDAALRRRFAFVELMPDPSALGGASVGGLPLGAWLRELNRRIVKHVGRDARNLQVGHAYLMHGGRAISEPSRLLEIFRDDIVPLLEEYCYEDFDALSRILGNALVRRETPDSTPTLVDFQDPKALIEAILQSFEDLATTPDAIAGDADAEDADEDDEANEPEPNPGS